MVRLSRILMGTAVALAVWSHAEEALAAPWSGVHQGRLFDDTDMPISGTLPVTFALYDDAGGGAELWSETVDIDFDEGYYSVVLGESTPFDTVVFDGSVRWLGVAIDADPEMSPRAPVHSVPYAMTATDAVGDINPNTVNIPGYGQVIDEMGNWVGPASGLVGPAGPAGPPGAPGPAGTAGADGIDGVDGAPGPQGATGAIGPAGPQGATGAIGPAGPAGPAGPQGATGAIGPAGPVGATGATGATGAIGPAGPVGATGAIGPAGPVGPQGATGAIGPAGPQGATGAIGPAGPVGATGAVGPAGPQGASWAPLPITEAIFGAGPITHFNGGDFVLEALDSDTLQLRRTAGGAFHDWSIIHPTACAGNGNGGSANMTSAWRYTTVAAQTLSGDLCLEGSASLITVHTGSNVYLWRCWRRTGNHNVCQRYW